MNLEEILKQTPNVVDVYKHGDITVIISHNPNGKPFREGLKDYFQKILDKEFGE